MFALSTGFPSATSAALELHVLQIADLGDRRCSLVGKRPAVGHLPPHAVLVGGDQIAYAVAQARDHQRTIGLEDRGDALAGGVAQAHPGRHLALIIEQHVADELLVGRVQVVRLERIFLAIDQLHGTGEVDLVRGLLDDHRHAVLTRQDLVEALGAGLRIGVVDVVGRDGHHFLRRDLRADFSGRQVGSSGDLPLADCENDRVGHGRLQRSNQFLGTFRSGMTSSLRLQSIWFYWTGANSPARKLISWVDQFSDWRLRKAKF